MMHSNGVAHRDLKPANILLANNWTQLKLTDFGLASNVANAADSLQGSKLTTKAPFPEGFTPRYAAPERFKEDAIVNRASDM